MGWKNWSYWLKGGIIGIIIYLLVISILHFFLLSGNNYTDCAIKNPDGTISPTACYSGSLADFIIYSPYFYIVVLVGALIGFIYGKMKNKKGAKGKK